MALLVTTEAAEQIYRTVHLERMLALRVIDPCDEIHADCVVARALEVLAGGDPPQAHEYPKDEAGSCIDCDAAALLTLA